MTLVTPVWWYITHPMLTEHVPDPSHALFLEFNPWIGGQGKTAARDAGWTEGDPEALWDLWRQTQARWPADHEADSARRGGHQAGWAVPSGVPAVRGPETGGREEERGAEAESSGVH